MGQGYSKPKHFTPEQDAEYRMTEEYKHEVTEPDMSALDPDESDPGPDMVDESHCADCGREVSFKDRTADRCQAKNAAGRYNCDNVLCDDCAADNNFICRDCRDLSDEEIAHMDKALGDEGRCEHCGCDIHDGKCPEGCPQAEEKDTCCTKCSRGDCADRCSKIDSCDHKDSREENCDTCEKFLKTGGQ